MSSECLVLRFPPFPLFSKWVIHGIIPSPAWFSWSVSLQSPPAWLLPLPAKWSGVAAAAAAAAAAFHADRCCAKRREVHKEERRRGETRFSSLLFSLLLFPFRQTLLGAQSERTCVRGEEKDT